MRGSPTKGAASSRRRAAAPASASRSSARRSGSIRIRRIRSRRRLPFDGEGLPVKRIDWIDKGVLKNLSYSRYWAQKQGKEPTPQTGQPDHGRRHGVDGRPDQGRRARRARDALLVYPLARSADAAGHRPDARRPVPDRKGQGDAAGEEHAVEREPGLRAEQPRRDDARRSGRSAAKGSAAPAFRSSAPARASASSRLRLGRTRCRGGSRAAHCHRGRRVGRL